MIHNKQGLEASGTVRVRYALLDELRGFMVLCMVVYHGLYTLFDLTEIHFFDAALNFFMPAEPFFAGGFLLLSGYMCGFSRSNIRRGCIALALAFGITAVTVGLEPQLGKIAIWFGILHVLGFGMLFCGLLHPLLKRVNKWVGFLVCVALFVVTFGIPTYHTDFLGIRGWIPAGWWQNPYLFPLGITVDSFYSTDYFPILPWLFLFLCGYYLFRFGIVQRHERMFLPTRCRPIAFVGRHALLVYVLHQPVIYGLFYGVQFLLHKG